MPLKTRIHASEFVQIWTITRDDGSTDTVLCSRGVGKWSAFWQDAGRREYGIAETPEDAIDALLAQEAS